jgi:LuxR family transcriptional regulator, maltose regulon positive regulatory protein
VRRARIAKSCALLAYLVHARGRATRDELIDVLFDGRAGDSTGAYLRQAVHGLRLLLPEPVKLLREGDVFVLDGWSLVETDTMLLEARLAGASAQIGVRRLEATLAAVEEHASAHYLEGVESSWVAERRQRLAAMLVEARVETAVAALEISRCDVAQPVLEAVVAEQPYREQAWRLLMRLAAAQGRDDHVVDLYRRCEAALRTLGLTPARSTRLLVEGLRR